MEGFEHIEIGITPELRAIADEFVAYLKTYATIAKPLSHRVLCHRFDLRTKAGRYNDVALRGLVNWLRAKGDPEVSRIGSTGKGYYWIHNEDEAEKTYSHLNSRIIGTRIAIRGIKQSFSQEFQQERLSL